MSYNLALSAAFAEPVSFSSIVHDYFAAVDFESELGAIQRIALFTGKLLDCNGAEIFRADCEARRNAKDDKWWQSDKRNPDDKFSFSIAKLPETGIALERTVAVKRTFQPVKSIVRPIREKISRDVPSPLRRMANASDQIASAMETKNQATLPIADQLARLAKHHAALESDFSRAIANGNQRKVDALSDKMERNRSYVQDLIDTLNDGQHSLVCFIDKDQTSYVAGYAAMPSDKPAKPVKAKRKAKRKAKPVKVSPVKVMSDNGDGLFWARN